MKEKEKVKNLQGLHPHNNHHHPHRHHNLHSSSLASSDESEYSSHKTKKCSKKSSRSHDLPLLKLDVKFDFPTYDGELNVEKLDNWVKLVEVYCRVQKIIHDTSRILLDTLRPSERTLIWWECQTQVDLIQHGKIISSWIEFTTALRNKFYPLAYMQTSMIAWQHLRQGKWQNFQAYT